VDAVLLAELDVLAVALDCVDALFWLARLASNILRSRLSWLLPDTVRLMIDSPIDPAYASEILVKIRLTKPYSPRRNQ
jgi:hypothetical protein